MSKWIDFKTLRRDLNFETVLAAYGVEINARVGKNGRQHSGPCPFQKCKTKPPRKTFSANLDRGIWQCFGCRQGGNALDFIILMEGLDKEKGEDVQRAAEIAKEKFFGETGNKRNQPSVSPVAESTPAEVKSPYTKTLVNEPLDFQLQSLDSTHGWFRDNGLDQKTVEHFGLGMCSRGWLKGRIAVPLHDNQGRLIGYAGRLPDEKQATDENPLYLFPRSRVHQEVRHEFCVSSFLYHRHTIEKPVRRLLLTFKLEEVWWLWQHGYAEAVSIMGGTCSSEQKEAMLSVISQDGAIGIVTRNEESGSAFVDSIMQQLARCCMMRWYIVKSNNPALSLDRTAPQDITATSE